MWGGYFDVRDHYGRVIDIYYDQVPNSATNINYGTRTQMGQIMQRLYCWKNGVVQTGGVISVLIKAGETSSNYFEVQTWKEKITTDNDIHSSTAGNEYVETLSMAITTVTGNNLDTVKYDNTYKNVNIHDGTCVLKYLQLHLI